MFWVAGGYGARIKIVNYISMEAKEKAIELVKKFLSIEDTQARYGGNLMFSEEAKQCAIISVDEIIEACEYNKVESYNTDWWLKVKEEILKL